MATFPNRHITNKIRKYKILLITPRTTQQVHALLCFVLFRYRCYPHPPAPPDPPPPPHHHGIRFDRIRILQGGGVRISIYRCCLTNIVIPIIKNFPFIKDDLVTDFSLQWESLGPEIQSLYWNRAQGSTISTLGTMVSMSLKSFGEIWINAIHESTRNRVT